MRAAATWLIGLGLALVSPGRAAGGRMVAGEPPQPVAGKRVVLDGALPLREVVKRTLEQNPLLEIRREQVAAAMAGERIEAAVFDPTVTADLRGASSREASAASELDGAAQPESTSVTAGAGVVKPLGDGSDLSLEWDALDRGKSNSSYASINPSYDTALRLTLRKPLLAGGGREVKLPGEVARLETLGAFAQWRAEIESVLVSVETAYWEIESLRMARDLRRQALDVARMILDETKARDTTRVEVLEAEANWNRIGAELAEADKLWRDALDRLFQFAGMLGGWEPGALRLDPLPEVGGAAPDVAAAYADALHHGVDARLDENALALARMDVERARFGLRPVLDLAVSGGLLGRDASQRRANEAMLDGNGSFVEGGLELRIPWGMRAEKARLAQAESRERQERARIENARTELYSQLREQARRITLGGELLHAATTAVRLNRARYEEQRARRSAGDAVLRDVLEARTALDEAALAEVRARLALVLARLELVRARGALPARHGLILDFRKESPEL